MNLLQFPCSFLLFCFSFIVFLFPFASGGILLEWREREVRKLDYRPVKPVKPANNTLGMPWPLHRLYGQKVTQLCIHLFLLRPPLIKLTENISTIQFWRMNAISTQEPSEHVCWTPEESHNTTCLTLHSTLTSPLFNTLILLLPRLRNIPDTSSASH